MSSARPLRVWVTRAQPGARATAARLEQAGHQAIVAPLLTVQSIPDVAVDLDGVAALAFTSARGVEAFSRACLDRTRPVFAVGDATAGAAWDAGFTDVVSARADGAALADLILSRRPNGVLLHPGAVEQAFDLVSALVAGGQAARGLAVYRTAAVEHRPVAAERAQAVLIHSPKAARALAGFASDLPIADIAVFALSDACAAPLLDLGFASLAVAPFPTEAALLKLLE